jgi:hypothetical protein
MTPTLAGRVAHPEGTQWQPMPRCVMLIGRGLVSEREGAQLKFLADIQRGLTKVKMRFSLLSLPL